MFRVKQRHQIATSDDVVRYGIALYTLSMGKHSLSKTLKSMTVNLFFNWLRSTEVPDLKHIIILASTNSVLVNMIDRRVD